jgi:short-subunit dehydrogenase
MRTASPMSSAQPEPGTALITGASSGIGATYADRLARRGYDLYLVARDQQRLDALATRLQEQTGRAVRTLRADLTNRADLLSVAERLRIDGAITMLVNNAGTIAPGTLLDGDFDALEAMIQLNVVAATRLAVEAARVFVTRGHGTIVNIASVLALTPERVNGGYSGSKSFVLNLTQALQAEAEATGVRVQAVLPGATRTELWQRSGRPIDSLPAEILMDVDELVDAALFGLDHGETITIPSLEDLALWQAFSDARAALGPHLSRRYAAQRYGTERQAAASSSVA